MSAFLPLYERLLFEDLRLSADFLRSHKTVVDQRLRNAACELKQPAGEFVAFNECLHVANRMVQQGSDRVDVALDRIRHNPCFQGQHPRTIVTVATLYYLLRRASARSASRRVRQQIAGLRRRFADMNWLVGPEAMQALGIRPLKTNHRTRREKP